MNDFGPQSILLSFIIKVQGSKTFYLTHIVYTHSIGLSILEILTLLILLFSVPSILCYVNFPPIKGIYNTRKKLFRDQYLATK